MSATETKPKSSRARAHKDKPEATPVAYGGAITIPSGCKPSKAVCSDRTRPVLCHAFLLERKDGLWLCATNSYIAAAIKVDGEAQPGWVPMGALKRMEAKPKHADAKQESATAWSVRDEDGSRVTFDVATTHSNTTPPDFEGRIGMWDKPEDGEIALGSLQIGVNPDLLHAAAKAIGAGNSSPLRVTMTAPLKPFRLSCGFVDSDRIAIVMPVRLNT